MPTREARIRTEARKAGHKVTGPREGWNANSEAVALLLAAFGYPSVPPTPIASLALKSCRFHVLP